MASRLVHQWSRKHRHTQERLCERFVTPAITDVLCEDIEVRHMQDIVNAASTPGEGCCSCGVAVVDRVQARHGRGLWQIGVRPGKSLLNPYSTGFAGGSG
jgi:hypothetical protein